MAQIDHVRLTAQISPHQNVFIIAPRRCGKTTFLSQYVNHHGDARTVYLPLTTDQCHDFAQTVIHPIQCTSAPCTIADVEESVSPPLIILDEVSFMNPRALVIVIEKMVNRRVLAISSEGGDPAILNAFMNAGFVFFNAC